MQAGVSASDHAHKDLLAVENGRRPGKVFACCGRTNTILQHNTTKHAAGHTCKLIMIG